MKKYLLLFIFLLAVGSIFQACNNSKTYAEMLEDERSAVDDYIKANNIRVISIEEFERDTVTDVAQNEYVSFSNGVYMQIVERYAVRGGERYLQNQGYANLNDAPLFVNNNLVVTRFTEVDIMTNEITRASNVNNKYEYLNTYPDGFRYTSKGSNIYGQFVAEAGLAYYFDYGMASIYDTSVPAGWLMALQYIRDGAHVKLIIPSKSGHTISQQYVYPFFYDIKDFSIY